MAKKLYEEANIQAIADAIREKNGLSSGYKVAEMADAILVLDAGGSGSAATMPIQTGWEFSKVMEALDSYTMGDCRYTTGTFFGSFSGANMGVGLRSKTKINLTDVDVLHVEFAAYGIVAGTQISVYVQNEIGSSAVAGDVVDRVVTEEEISAGSVDVDVSSVSGSYYIVMGAISWYNKTVSIAISKIQADVVYGGTNTGTDQSDATATENHILYPETAYVNGVKVTGAIQSIAAQTYTPGTVDQVIAAGQYLSGAQTIRGDENLVSGNIKSGVSIFGIAGSYEGSAESSSSEGAILPPASSWTLSKVLEQEASYTIDQCSFSGDVFVGSVTGSNKGAGIRSNAKIDLTDVQYLHIEFTAAGISSGNNQFCVYAKDDIGTNATEGVLDKVATSDEIAAGYMDIDVSAITGSYYLFMGLVRWGGGNAVAAISKVTLKGSTTA